MTISKTDPSTSLSRLSHPCRCGAPAGDLCNSTAPFIHSDRGQRPCVRCDGPRDQAKRERLLALLREKGVDLSHADSRETGAA